MQNMFFVRASAIESDVIVDNGNAHANLVKQSRTVRKKTFPFLVRRSFPRMSMESFCSLERVAVIVTGALAARGGFLNSPQLKQF